jgi:ATP-dependent DNA helicase
MKQEEEQLQDTWLKTEEEEEARKREEATILALDSETQYSKLDELLTKTTHFGVSTREKMDRLLKYEIPTVC